MAPPPPPPSLVDRLLAERVLFPLLGAVLLGSLLFLGLRPKQLGPAADFELPTVAADGSLGREQVHLAALRGSPVLLDFWATWCAPCRVELPILASLHRRYGPRGLRVVGVNVDEGGPSLVPQFRQRFGLDYVMVYDVEGRGSRAFNVQGLPTLVLVDKSGQVRLRHAGTATEEELARAVESAL
jgi:cytochrome c biogenesis protein CcmG/thiol:disulfide interchange protein DsbE